MYSYPRKNIRGYFRKNYEYDLRVWLAKNYPEITMPKPDEVVNYIYWGTLWLIIAGPICLYLVICRCLCAIRKPRGEYTAFVSSSENDVLKAKKKD